MTRFCTVFVFLSCLLAPAVYGQAPRQSKIVDDFDHNGRKDYLVMARQAEGDGEEYKLDLYMNGSKKPEGTTGEYNYSGFLSILQLPASLPKQAARTKVPMFLFGSKATDSLASAVRWFGEIVRNKEKVTDKSSDFSSAFSLKWASLQEIRTDKQVTLVSTSSIRDLVPVYNESEQSAGAFSLVTYFGNNQGPLKYCDSSSDGHKLYMTNHGVVLSKNGKYAWLFISDIAIFGSGSEKLRWPSVKSAKLFGDHVVFEVASSTTESSSMYLVNIRSGKLVRINNDHFHIGTVKEYKIEDSSLIVRSTNNDEIRIRLEDLFR